MLYIKVNTTVSAIMFKRKSTNRGAQVVVKMMYHPNTLQHKVREKTSNNMMPARRRRVPYL